MRYAGHSLTALLATALLGGCGDGTIIFGGDFDDKPASLSIAGDIKDQTPANASRDVVVFVFTDMTAEALAGPPPYERYPRVDGSLDPTAPENFKDQESRVLDDAGTFRIPDVEAGSITVMFLLDKPEPDGQIDLDDEYAIFIEDGSKLRNVKGGRTVNIPEIEILYDVYVSSTGKTGTATTDEEITTVIEREDDDN